MNVLIESYRPGGNVREHLEQDGWRVLPAPDGALLASHRFVLTEPEARQRLHRIGLLTSGGLRIEFLPAGVAETGH